jgi:hypothetical protein
MTGGGIGLSVVLVIPELMFFSGIILLLIGSVFLKRTTGWKGYCSVALVGLGVFLIAIGALIIAIALQ